MIGLRHVVLRTSALACAILARAIDLTAQSECAQPGPSTLLIDRSSAELPVDRIADLLALEPGVGSLQQGALTIRGSGTDAVATYLNGVPVTPGRRGGAAPLLGGSYLGEAGSGIGIGTNGFAELRLSPGFAPAGLGHGSGGILEVWTIGPCNAAPMRDLLLKGGWATDAVLGEQNGLNFNRLTFQGEGGTGRLSASVSVVAEGQGTARLGLEQNESPVYLADGVDTTVTVAGAAVDVLRFRPSEGIRLPASAASSYTVLGTFGYQLNERHRLRLTAAASQAQAREFDYENLYDPVQLRAGRNTSRVLGGTWLGTLRENDRVRLTGEVHLSWQADRSAKGPLTSGAERNSRDPFAGLMLGALDIRFEDFAVNDELVRNFRLNSGRLSPYDLNNPAQYQPIDEFRNNAYGLTGFSDRGGPVGLLELYRETRLVARGAISAQLGPVHRITAGAEAIRYQVDFYRSQLTSQIVSDAYVESPSAMALHTDYQLQLTGLQVQAGARYDRFRTGASRSEFPRISSAPGFDPANPTAGFRADRAHGEVSPRLAVAAEIGSHARAFGSVAVRAQMPDFAAGLAGINTDLSITNFSYVFGSDLDFQRSTIGELGAILPFGFGSAVTTTIWTRSDKDVVAVRLSPEFDPQTQADRDIRRFRNVDGGSATGLDVRIGAPFAVEGRAWLSYSYADPDDMAKTTTRPHTLAGAILYRTSRESRLAGGLLREVGVYGDFRVASGTSYTRCSGSAVSDQPCVGGIEGDINGSRLPAVKLVDLRVTKTLHLGPTTVTAFADARNLFNSRNVLRVFTQTGTTFSRIERGAVRSQNLDSYAAEAGQNGVRDPVSGTVDLSFGGATDPRTGCGAWVNGGGAEAAPNCVYLIRAEERFGNGDHLFTLAEQTRASDALYFVSRGLQNFTGPGRRVRLGLELRF